MTEKMEKAVDTLMTWWPSYSEDTRRLFVAILASLPGGEDLHTFVVGGDAVTLNLPALGWHELAHLVSVLSALECPDNVRTLAEIILEEEGVVDAEEDVEE